MAILKIKDADGNIIEIPAIRGKDGKSAYEIAVDYGYNGTESEWTEILKTSMEKHILYEEILTVVDDTLDFEIYDSTMRVFCYKKPDRIPLNAVITDIKYHYWNPNTSKVEICSFDDLAKTNSEPFPYYANYSKVCVLDGESFNLGLVTAFSENPIMNYAKSYSISAVTITYYLESPFYKLISYLMDLEGNYSEAITEIKKGKADVEISISPETKEGFLLDTENSILRDIVNADGSTTLIIKYIRNQYKLRTIVDGEETSSTDYYYESPVTVATPTKTGYTFSGWDVPATMPAKDVTLSGTFNINKYTINYYVNNELLHTDVYEYGAAITPWTYTPAEGESFSGWDVAVPATMPAGDVSVYGTTGTASYTVTFTIDGEVYKTIEVAYGAAITVPEVADKTGYTFSGWDVPATMPAGNQTYDATYEYISYAVTLYVDGDVYQSYEKYPDESFELPLPPNKDGYEFYCWEERNVGSCVYPEYLTIYMPRANLEYDAIYIENNT